MPAVLLVLPLCVAAFATDLDSRQRVQILAGDPLEAKGSPADAVFDAAQIAPYFRTSPLSDAVRELVDGHASPALKLIPEKALDAPTRFLRALAVLASGDHAQAALLFELLAPDYPAMRARCDCLAASAFATIGDLPGALRHELGCADDPVRGRGARVENARMLAKVGKKDDAALALEVLAQMSGAQRLDALFALGQLREDMGQDKEALVAYREIFVGEPASFFAEKARARATALVKRAKLPPLSTARLADRTDRLLAANLLKMAAAQLKELPVVALCEGPACAVHRCRPGEPVVVAAAPVEPPKPEVVDGADGAAPEVVEEAVEKPAPAPVKTFEIMKVRDDEPYTEALPLPTCTIETVKAPADAVACRVELLRAVLARKTRANPKALELARVVYEHCADPDVRARAAFIALGAAAAVHDPDATDLARIAAFQFKDHALSDDALFSAANLARERKDRFAERTALRRLVNLHVDSDQRAEALFRLFWSHRADGRPDRGLPYLETLWKEYDAGPRGDGGDAERGRYWWGRTVVQAAVPSDRPKGLDVLATLARDRPMTYYGLLARSFAASVDSSVNVIPAAPVPLAGALRTGLVAQDRGFQEGVELARIGLLADARDALRAVDFRPLRADGRRGREATLVVLELLRTLDDDRSAHTLARRELLRSMRDSTDPLARRASLVAFPLAFRDSIQVNATKQGFAPNFLQGLMREESALDPHAHSPVGARGLTQLMPATARAVAKSLGLKAFNADKLWEPKTNIEIGSVYLGRMLKTFGHPGLAAAAYNAGPGAVTRWLLTASSVFDEFVEEIPFTETRGYVKRVLRSYAAYQYLYEPDAARGMKVGLALKAALPEAR